VTRDRPVLVHRPSLEARGLSRNDLVPSLPYQWVNDEEVADWILRAARTVPM
jgi:hypothetical protein